MFSSKRHYAQAIDDNIHSLHSKLKEKSESHYFTPQEYF